MPNQILVHIEKLNPDIKLPAYANLGDSGMDVMASEDIIINAQSTVIVKTGLKVAIPYGYEIQVRPRSGISLNTPLRVSNSPGTIDSEFRGEIGIIITNISTSINNVSPITYFSLTSKGKQGNYYINKGDKIAQLVLQKVPRILWVEVNDIEKIGGNRNGGFGSTGI